MLSRIALRSAHLPVVAGETPLTNRRLSSTPSTDVWPPVASSGPAQASYSPLILQEIRASARKPPTSVFQFHQLEACDWFLSLLRFSQVSLHNMFQFGADPTPKKLLQGAQFLHKELPIRLARRAAELDSLPYGLSLMVHICGAIHTKLACILLNCKSASAHREASSIVVHR